MKASILRGYRNALERAGLLDAVLARVPPETRELLATPPPSSTWTDFARTEEIAVAVSYIRDVATWRAIAHEAALNSVAPLLRGAVEGLLRAFGATPHALFNRFNQMTSSTMRGVTIRYKETSEQTGEMIFAYNTSRRMPYVVFHGAAGGMEVVFDFCGVSGTLGEPEMLQGENPNVARYSVTWSKRGAKGG